MSKTRQRFMERKKAKRDHRKYLAWQAEHHFPCEKLRRRHGEMKACEFPVYFRKLHEGVRAQCRYCGQEYTYAKPSMGLYTRPRWLKVEEAAELVLPAEAVVERTVQGERQVAIVDHAQFCSDKTVPLIGLIGVLTKPGRVEWKDFGKRIVHVCFSSEAGRRLAAARWGNAG